MNTKRERDEVWWQDPSLDGQYKVIMRGQLSIAGWVVKIDDKYVARVEELGLRAEFDTSQEAEDFLMLICKSKG
jgi:hypothetical protein